ncbi:cytochrome C oxidase subunit IV family protein [Rehaibacterium terrae]|uniref:Cytochrome c oxidase subunit IV n=1 Tax=Rehaibacterium terrae TaxID=1341696 RepID=A0A7W7V7J0_9GAMM|nr:cytochrome C oxidase subunit IV family protein [Rehaibacterium terrae]MBB5014651.1 cytochrome c oxidase subunit IV [Rehaibacterium terrae]
MSQDHAQQHPLSTYLWVWFLLFLLSVFSYMVDYVGFEGLLKWSLITLFMLLKAGLIVAVFMHMVWERLAIVCAVLVPPGVLVFLMLLMALEADYTLSMRLRFFSG